MFTDSSSASPNAPATQTSLTVPQEEAMHSNMSALIAAAGSSASTNTIHSAGKEVNAGIVGSSEPSTTSGGATEKKKRPTDRYGIELILEKAKKKLAKASGNTDETVIADVEKVKTEVAALLQTKSELWVASEHHVNALAAVAPHVPGVKRALTPVAAILQQQTEEGSSLYRLCKSRDHLTTARAVLKSVPLRKMGVEHHLVAALERAVEAAAPARRASETAGDMKETAQKQVVTAKLQLLVAVQQLGASLVRQRVQAKLEMARRSRKRKKSPSPPGKGS